MAHQPEARKVVTVLFTDVVGSTALGSRLDPELLRNVMWRYFETVQAALERHGATVEKFIGDAVMAVFGVPLVREDDALRAVRAAVEIREMLRALNDELAAEHELEIEIRTGVNTGEVIVGGGAPDQKLATGDAVNVAARLEQAASAALCLHPERRPADRKRSSPGELGLSRLPRARLGLTRPFLRLSNRPAGVTGAPAPIRRALDGNCDSGLSARRHTLVA